MKKGDKKSLVYDLCGAVVPLQISLKGIDNAVDLFGKMEKLIRYSPVFDSSYLALETLSRVT